MTTQDSDTINVTRAIDDGPFSWFQIGCILLCSLVAFLDGADSQSIAIAGPIIAGLLGLTRAALGPIFSAGLLGAMIGALTFGPLGDRFGRKRMLILATVIFGVFTLLTAYAFSYESLLLTRFLAGLGLGGATPCFIALATEYAPKRRRAMIASLIWAAFPLGVAVGSFANAFIVANYGWQAMFLIGGVLPLLVAVLLMIWVPESIRYLIATKRDPAQVRRTMSRIAPGLPATARFVAEEERLDGVPLKHLFTNGRAVPTLLLWISFIMSFGILAIIVAWAPILLADHGFSPAQAGTAIGLSGIGALLGMASAGRLMERFGATAMLVPALLLGAIATSAVGYAAGSIQLFSAVLVLVGLFVGLGASGSIALAALTYPTAIRSTGVGWAMGMGRFGQVVMPLLTASLTTVGWSGGEIFLAYGLAPLCAALAIFLLRRQSGQPATATTIAEVA